MAIGKTKSYSTREMVRILMNNGFEYVSCSGDHKKFRRDNDIVIVNRKISKMICRRLIKTYNLKK